MTIFALFFVIIHHFVAYVKSFYDVFYIIYMDIMREHMNIKVELGKRLKEARRSCGLTQKEVSAKLLMTQQQYSRFENGIFELNYEQIVFLCKLYDVSADYLLGLREY